MLPTHAVHADPPTSQLAHLLGRVEIDQEGGMPLEAIAPGQAGGESILQAASSRRQQHEWTEFI